MFTKKKKLLVNKLDKKAKCNCNSLKGCKKICVDKYNVTRRLNW